MANNRLSAPVIEALNIREQYHKDLAAKLFSYNLSNDTRTTIITDIYAKDDLYFSFNRPYEQITSTFEDFCKQAQLHYSLPEMLPYLSGDKHHLYTHQAEAVKSILAEKTTIISTGTGSGKTESFLIPILDHCLKIKSVQPSGIKAIILYPLNALADDQIRRILEAVKDKGLHVGCYVGSTPKKKLRTKDDPLELCISREEMQKQPPDILVTNYVMLDRLITQSETYKMFERSSSSLKYIVVDEIHYFRGTKGANLSLLLRRLRTFCKRSLVQIGASGTLRRGGGYYPNQTKDQIETFVRLIFGPEALTSRGFTLIEPVFQALPPVEPIEPLPPIDTIHGDTFLTTLTEAKASILCTQLFPAELISTYQQRYCQRGKTIKAFPGYYLALHSVFIQQMRLLLTTNACSFQTLVDLYEHMYNKTYGRPPQESRKIVEAYWSLINYLNMRCLEANLPFLLDYRIHLILGDVGDELTRCLLCSRYHDGRCQRCRFCNNGLLFKVSELHPNSCVAYLVDNALFPERVVDQRSFPVLVDIISQQKPSSLSQPSFILEPSSDGDNVSYLLRPASLEAEHTVTLQLVEDKGAIKPLLLNEKYRYWINVLKIVDALVLQEGAKKDKLLGFIDSREGASGVKLRLTDDIAERTLSAWATSVLSNSDAELSLIDAFELMTSSIPKDDEESSILLSLLQEMPFWFKRMLTYHTEEDLTSDWDLSLSSSLDLTLSERELLAIVLASAAIDTSSFVQPGGIHDLKYFHVEKYRVETEYCVSLKSATERGYHSISFGEQGVLHRDFIQRVTSAEIEQMLENLTTRGILVKKTTSADLMMYQIHPQYVILKSLRQPSHWDALFASIESHTADNSAEERADIERRFNEAQIHALICTPTLEMGVDIGQLNSVLMIGFPPSPANYSQRAGRAGRGSKNRSATIVVLSSSRDSHDEYYYAVPYKMIDGEITPPQFTLVNFSLLASHAYAFIMAGSSQLTLLTQSTFLQEKIHLFLERDMLQVAPVIGPQQYENFARYLTDDARSLPTRIQKFIHGPLSVNECYKLNIFPDYGFRNDGLPLLDASTDSQNAREDTFDFLTSREPEEAPRSLVPGRIVFCGGRAVQIEEHQPSLSYEIRSDPLQKPFRYHKYVVADTTRTIQLSRQRDPHTLYLLRRYLAITQPVFSFLTKGRQYCELYYIPESTLYIINEGEVTLPGQAPIPLKDQGSAYRFGSSLEREGLLIRFADDILSDNMKANFLAILLRCIPDYFNLDDGELRVVQNVTINPQNNQNVVPRQSYFFIYGQDKSGLVPFNAIFEQLDSMLSAALKTLIACSCRGSGCYLCLFSMNSHRLIGHMSHSGAVNFLSAYLGLQRLKPHLAFHQSHTAPIDLTLYIRIKGDIWEISAKRSITTEPTYYRQQVQENQNETLYLLLHQVLTQQRNAGATSVKICCKVDHVVKQLRGENAINNGRKAFFMVWLERLQWLYWHVVKEDIPW